ncbi:MAG: hypothetical protein JJU31_11290 [Wenzhouxiangella sp.]|nr:hypothetical protein [Wenzhouxiangella sp.]MCH8479138.1 hypothetical protein [Wenzhouxiangella sp.]
MIGPGAELESFLSGIDRRSLNGYRQLLRSHQAGLAQDLERTHLIARWAKTRAATKKQIGKFRQDVELACARERAEDRARDLSFQ